jgi:hypothetical protein
MKNARLARFPITWKVEFYIPTKQITIKEWVAFHTLNTNNMPMLMICITKEFCDAYI